MGNKSSKENANNLFTSDEIEMLENAYRKAKDSINELSFKRLVEIWSAMINQDLAISTAKYLLKQQTNQTVTFEMFSEPFYILKRGSNETKVHMILKSVGNGTNSINMSQLELYICNVIKSYIQLELSSSCSRLREWQSIKCLTTEASVTELSRDIVRNVIIDSGENITAEILKDWFEVTPMFVQIWEEVFHQIYSRQSCTKNFIQRNYNKLIPQLSIPPANGQNMHYRSIVEIPHLLFLNSNLPHKYRHKWRFLYSSKINGESFSTMLGRIMNKGPTLFIVEDEDKYIFGAYAPESWNLKPQFTGNDTSMMFTLSPVMRCFSATGYNNHYQYLNLNQQTMPNGLGMGGQFNYWGLWIDSTFGDGQSSESCSTYRDYVQLSKQKQFKIRNLEVWAVGDELIKEGNEGLNSDRSVLDKNLEDRAILEISGKKMHSDGLRELDVN